jgi:hypothetical protein
MAPTKDELEAENAELRKRLEDLERSAPAGTAANTEPPAPERPGFLSAGEADDLRNNGVTTSPFNGELLNALDEGIEPGNPDALKAAERARDAKKAAAGVAPATA